MLRFRSFLFIAIAIALSWLAHPVGLRGDAAPLNVDGPERAKYHIIALALTLGAPGFFIAAKVGLLRGHRR